MSCASVIKLRFQELFQRAGHDHIVIYDSATQGILASYRDTDSINAIECKADGLLSDKQPSAAVPVVYFLYPTATNVTWVVDDLRRRPYSSYQLVFTTALSPNDRQVIDETARTFRRDVAIQDNFLAFSLAEPRVAVTNQKDAIAALSSNTRDEWVDSIMPAVASLLLALGEQPCIRYGTSGTRAGSGKLQHIEMQDITYRAAMVLQQHMRSANANRPLVHRPEGTADALIIHRGFDLVSALIHDPTLEAVLHDLHPPSAPAYEDDHGNILEMPQLVEEQQQKLWDEIRHLTPKQAADLLVDIEEDVQNAGKRVREEKATLAVQALMDRQPRRMAAQALYPHLRLRWPRIEALLALGQAERQVVANGGRDAEEVAVRVLEEHDYPNKDDVVRLLVLCRWAAGRPLASTKLTQLAGQELLRTAEKVVQHLEGRYQWTRTWRQTLAPQAPKSPRGTAPPPPPVLPPLLSNLLQAAATNTLPPHLLPPLPADPSETRRNNLRVGFNWAARTLTDGPDPSVNTRRLVVVLLGGLAPAEIRLAHQLSRQLHRNILLVSTSLQHPNELVHYSFHHAPAPPSTPPGSPYGSRGPTPTFDSYHPSTPPASPPPHPSHHFFHHQPHHQPPSQQQPPQQPQPPHHRLFPIRHRAGAPGHQRHLSNPDALHQMRLSPASPDPYQQPPPSSHAPRHAATPPPSRPTHQRRLSDPQALYENLQQPTQTSGAPPPSRTSPDPTILTNRPRSPLPLRFNRPQSPHPPPSPPATRQPSAQPNPFPPHSPDPHSAPLPRQPPPSSYNPLTHHQSASPPPLNQSARTRTPPPVHPSSRLRRVGGHHARHTSEILNTPSPPPPSAYPSASASNPSSAWAAQDPPTPPQPPAAAAGGYPAYPQAAPEIPRWYTPDGVGGAQPLPAAQYQPYQTYQPGSRTSSTSSGGGGSSSSSSKPGWLKKAIRRR